MPLIAGLVKLIHPHGEVTNEELRDLLELAMEGRRRVKEQLKKMGSFEFFQTSCVGNRQAQIGRWHKHHYEVSGDVAERLDPIFYGHTTVAANKALGNT
jgi:hypothetical protein